MRELRQVADLVHARLTWLSLKVEMGTAVWQTSSFDFPGAYIPGTQGVQAGFRVAQWSLAVRVVHGQQRFLYYMESRF